jgi:hypothetical protein
MGLPMMIKNLSRLLALALLAATPALASTAPGTNLHLLAVPSFASRLFVPVVPDADNRVQVDTLPFDTIVAAPAGFTVALDKGALVIDAPDGEAAGYATVRSGKRELTLTLVNLVPYSQMEHGTLDGYRVGEYEAVPLHGLEQYEPPKGFVRLTDVNSSLWVSDHYRMRDFQCKLDGTNKFLILRTDALVKLELLQHELQTRGLAFDRFTIMSGFRTPYYNSKIGNETSYSRHLYGDAMDIYVDRDGDGKMDDLDGNGKVDSGDAKYILGIAEQLDNSREWGWLKGGAGVYHANAAHGPYIHIDARGFVARWGV